MNFLRNLFSKKQPATKPSSNEPSRSVTLEDNKKIQKKELAIAMIKLINAARGMGGGKPLIDDKEMPLWLEILMSAPDHIFEHPEQHWVIENYVKEEIKKRSA